MPEGSDTEHDRSGCDDGSQVVRWKVEDPSEYRPELLAGMGKEIDKFRVYNETDARFDIVKQTYALMHKHQTVESVRERRERWCRLDHCKMTMMDAIIKLDLIVDESDPDTSLPNSVHAFQTAERIRAAYPDKDWFHLTGLIHDVGKMLAIWGEPQYAVVGDTFPVGCAFSDKCVHHQLFADNPDFHDNRYNTKYGIYEPNCGLNNVMMSFGHDEYLYQVLVGNKQCTLPEQALYIVRFHSFYPWHTSGDYDYLCNDKDREMLEWVQRFNQYDLYSKADEEPNPQELKEYYQSLMDKYTPGLLAW